MSKYRYGVNFIRRWKFFRKTRKVLVVLTILLILILLAIFIDSWLLRRQASQPSKISTPTTSTIAPSTEIFVTDFFQFQTDKNWYHIQQESTASKFVYRRIKNSLVEYLICRWKRRVGCSFNNTKRN